MNFFQCLKNLKARFLNEVKDKIPSITNLPTTVTLNAKTNEVRSKTPNITNLASTTAFTAVENKIPNVSNLVKKTHHNTKTNEIEKKLLIIIMTYILLHNNLIS